MIFTVLLAILIIPAVIWSLLIFRLEMKLSNIRKVPGLPIFENLFVLTKLDNVLDSIVQFQRTYGNIMKVNLFVGFSSVMIADLRLIEFILGTTQILRKSINYTFLHNWLGQGLLTSLPDKWKKTRKILTPAFHFQILEHYIETFHTASHVLVEKLKSQVGKGSFDVYPYITLCTLDIICESAMGTKVNAQENTESEYVKGVRELCRIVVARSLNPAKLINFLYRFTNDYKLEKKSLKVVHDYTKSVIRNRRQEVLANGPAAKNTKRLAFLDLLLQCKIDDRPMTDDEIRQEVDTFMFEGHDTTASGISFILYCLSQNPDVQEKVFREVEDIFEGLSSDRATVKELNEMKYLDIVIKESLRLYPPVPVYGRSPTRDTKYYGGEFPMHCQMIIFAYGVHRDPDVYKNPEKFDPDRFLPENQIGKHPFSYLTFSAGPRNCIGQKFAMLEMKYTVSHIVRNFVIKPVIGYKPQLIPMTVLKSTNGIQIELEERL